MKLATNGLGRSVARARPAVPTLDDAGRRRARRPGRRARPRPRSRASRAASAGASSREQLARARRAPSRACARRAPRVGSSSSSTRRLARERARERDALALAARELRRACAPARWRDAEALEQAVAAAAPREARRSARRSGAGRARSPGRRSRPSAPPAASRCRASVSSQTASPQRAIRPRSGRDEAGDARSTVVLPAPDGPASATVSAPDRRALARGRSERSGTARSTRSASIEGSSLTARRMADADEHEQGADREGDVEVLVELRVDRERQRLGDALQAAGEHDRRAELAEPAREARASSRRRGRPRRAGARRAGTSRAGPAPSVRDASSRVCGRRASNAAIAWRR